MKKYVALALGILAMQAKASDAGIEAHPNNEVFSYMTNVVMWDGVAYSILLGIAVYILLKLFHNSVIRFGDKFTQQRLFFQKLETVVQFLAYIITAMLMILMSFRVNAQVLAVLGGTFAVAIGFAIKDVLASFLAGIIIMLDRPFQVGDRVRFGGEYGDITAIGLRSVRLQTLTDDTVTIPNNRFLNEMTVSGNYGNLHMQVNIPFYIGAEQNIELARKILLEAAASSRYIHLPKPVVVRVNQLLQDSIVMVRLTLKAYVLDTQYEKAFETDITVRVLNAFSEYHIKAPAMLHRSISDADVKE